MAEEDEKRTRKRKESSDKYVLFAEHMNVRYIFLKDVKEYLLHLIYAASIFYFILKITLR